ncbi:uncharacterized protein LOC105833032 [Monomorium pharaonis]|uniref:uncharacterized protein LOC105833032 n=1 Tax=Monomorium pharaonis TaxID=307658 RepID=UPI001747A44B|nr:uncharacterized protein LOC105833032 [Monomorium pharaonis]
MIDTLGVYYGSWTPWFREHVFGAVSVLYLSSIFTEQQGYNGTFSANSVSPNPASVGTSMQKTEHALVAKKHEDETAAHAHAVTY